jgi:hypothetical protein
VSWIPGTKALIALAVAAVALSACGQDDEEQIRESIEELSGPAVSVDHCDEIGEYRGRPVFDCYGPNYGPGPRLGCYSVGKADNVIEHDCSRFRAARRMPSNGGRDLGSPAAEEARGCLEAAGFDVLGGRSDPTDRDAPDVELTFAADGDQVFIAFYRDSEEAAQAEPAIRSDARSDWLVERRESVTIVWTGSPDPDSRATVEGCAFP